MKQSNKVTRLGFTLIELIIVTAVFGLVLAIGLASYNRINRRQIFQQAVENVLKDLRLAQSKALSGEKPPGCETAYPLYGFRFDSLLQAYEIVAVCETETGVNEITVKQIALPEGVEKNSGPDEILFRVLHQGVDLGGAESIELGFGGFGLFAQQIVVSETGEIYSFQPTPTPHSEP